MHRLLWLFLPALLWGQQIVYGPLVSNISHSAARITFVTDADPKNSEVEYGRTGNYGNVVAAIRNGSAPYTSMAILAGLSPSTTYRVRARLNDGTVLSNEVTFTTTAEPPVHPELPAEPVSVDASMPSGEYGNSSELAVKEDCSNLPDVLKKVAALSGDLNYEVVIPAGAECRGRFDFPARPNHNGWVVVRSSAVNGSSFPPEGVRWTPDWAGSTARFVTNILPVSIYAGVRYLTDVPCEKTVGEGGYAWAMDLGPSSFSLYKCSNKEPRSYSGANTITDMTGHVEVTITAPGHQLEPGDIISISDNGYIAANKSYAVVGVDGDKFRIRDAPRMARKYDTNNHATFKRHEYWHRVPFTTGDKLPETCNVEEWFLDTADGKKYWCTAPNQWRDFRIEPGALHSAIILRGEAKRYRFIGIEVTHEKMPEPYPEGWGKTVAGAQPQGVVRQLITSSSNQVVWDRCYIHGWPFPQRVGNGIAIAGENIAIINSYFDEIAWWRAAGYSQMEGSIGILQYEKGPVLIDNNYISVAGIPYFSPSNSLTTQDISHDVVFTNNLFRSHPKWRQGDPENNGYVYSNRNTWELKQGKVYRVEGNRFEYNYSGLTAGQFILLTPRCPDALPAPIPIVSITDGKVELKAPVSFDTGDVVVISGTNSAYDGLWELSRTECASKCKNFILLNAPNGSASGGAMIMRGPNRGVSDISIQYNSFSEGAEVMRLTGTTGCRYSHMPVTQRILFRNNVSNDINIRSFANGGRVDKSGTFRNGDFGARMVYNLGWVEDLIVTDNLFIGNRGNMPLLLMTEGVSEGLVFSNNVFTYDEQTRMRAVFHSGALGSDALDRGYRRDEHPNWVFENNVICCGLDSYASRYPPTTRWPASMSEMARGRKKGKAYLLYASLRPMLPGAKTFARATAAASDAESERTPEMELLAAKQGRVLDVQVEEVTANSATLSYLAPDAKACTVEFGTSARWGSGKRVRDAGGSREREVAFTGLPPQSAIHYRLLCAVEQPAGAFQTK